MRPKTLILLLMLVLGLLSLPSTNVFADEKPLISFGVIPRYNPMIMYQNYQPIMDYLTEVTPYRFELKLARDYPQVVEHLRTGVTQVASLGDVTFAAASQGFGARPILRPRNQQGQPDYYSLIVVRKESLLTDVAQLKGKSFAFGNIHSTSGNLIPRNYLFEHKVDLADLGRYENLPTHTDVALAVLKGQFDAGAVKDVVAHRYQESGLRVLSRSEPIPSVPIAVRADAPQELIDALSKALLAIDPLDPQHKKMLANWDPEFRNGFVPASTEDYRPVLQMLENISGGCGKSCHPQ